MASEDIFASAEIVDNISANLEENEEIAVDDDDDEMIAEDNEIEQQNNEVIVEKEIVEENESSTTDNLFVNNTISITKDKSVEKTHQEPKLIQLPLARIRGLMKLDPDLQLASSEAVFTVAKATEMFIESLARESYTFTAQAKKKTIQKRDVDLTFTSVDSLMFLEGAMNFD